MKLEGFILDLSSFMLVLRRRPRSRSTLYSCQLELYIVNSKTGAIACRCPRIGIRRTAATIRGWTSVESMWNDRSGVPFSVRHMWAVAHMRCVMGRHGKIEDMISYGIAISPQGFGLRFPKMAIPIGVLSQLNSTHLASSCVPDISRSSHSL
jgi:hypothetical protein